MADAQQRLQGAVDDMMQRVNASKLRPLQKQVSATHTKPLTLSFFRAYEAMLLRLSKILSPSLARISLTTPSTTLPLQPSDLSEHGCVLRQTHAGCTGNTVHRAAGM